MMGELKSDACEYIRAGVTLMEFYAKYEHNKAKSDLLIQHSKVFDNMW